MLSLFAPGSIGSPSWPVVYGAGLTPDAPADPQGVPAFELIPLSPRHIWTPADEVTPALAMRWSKYRGDEDVFEVNCQNILATGEIIVSAMARVEKITLGGFLDVTADFLWAHGPTRGTAYRCVFRDTDGTSQPEGQYRIRMILYTSLGRRLVTQVGLTVVA